MQSTRRFLATSLLLAGCLAAAAAHADITKCIDQAGHISYSDSSCGDAAVVGTLHLIGPDAVATPVIVEPARPSSPMALDNLQVRQSAWATMPVTVRRVSTDTATIQAAREALLATDRGLAALRSQKVAYSR